MRILRFVVLFLLFPTLLFAQTVWEVTTETDKLTDKPTLTAVAQTHTTGIYELTLKCKDVDYNVYADNNGGVTVASRHDMDVTLKTYSVSGEGRLIPWEHYVTKRVVNGTILGNTEARLWLSIRLDTTPVDTTVLFVASAYSNMGRMSQEHFPILPKTRLLVTGIFPDEIAEFDFTALTPDDRTAIQNMCIRTH